MPNQNRHAREKNYKTTKTIRSKRIRTNYRKRRIFDGISIVDEFDRFVTTSNKNERASTKKYHLQNRVSS